MTWNDIDTPELPFKKPRQLEELEKMGMDQREAMDPQEKKDRVRDTAYSLALSYQKYSKNKGDYDGCVAIVHSALSTMGNSIDGKLGALMVGMSDEASQEMCRILYPNDEE